MNRKNNKQQPISGKQRPDLENLLKRRNTTATAPASNTNTTKAKATETATVTTATTKRNEQASREAKMGSCQKATGAGEASKQQQTSGKLIKKAYVRFDDYLDLNEENMRRSCKRLMNHLYSESSSASAIVAPAIATCCQSQPTPTTGAPSPIKSVAVSGRSLPQTSSSSPSSIVGATSGSGGKSYLRSHYERRQQRQLDLVSRMQMQEETTTTTTTKTKTMIQRAGSKPIAGGASGRRQQQQQQDLVAKSHELSKRRFFEKLERRESIKNLTTTTNFNISTLTAHGKQQQQTSTTANHQIAELGENQQEAARLKSKQKSLAADDELMIKVYQSIVLKGEANKDTLGGLDGAADGEISCNDNNNTNHCGDTKEFSGELIGFYTPSPQSPAYGEQQQEQLIEFSTEKQQLQQQECSTLVADTAAFASSSSEAVVDESAFEIKVPASRVNSTRPLTVDSCDGLMSPSQGLLVVKQVEVSAQLDRRHHHHQLFQEMRTNEAAGIEVGPPTLSGRFKGEASTQLAGNKIEAKTPFDVVIGSTDNKVISTPVEQINGQGTSNDETIASAAVGQQQSASSIDGDNQQQKKQKAAKVDSISSAISSNSRGSNSNKMKTISSFQAMDSETTSYVCGSGELKKLGAESVSGSNSGLNKQNKRPSGAEITIEVGGETNRAEGHEAPEMRILLVRQSGGANGEANSAYPVQTTTQSAAQEQQVVSLQTTITTNKPATIRDVLPEANGTNRIEARIVSDENDVGKVAAISKQVNEVHQMQHQYEQQQQKQQQQQQHEGPKSDVYANSNALDGNESQKNNVNHDVSEQANEANIEIENIDLMGENDHNQHLIESFVKLSNLVQKHSITSSGGSVVTEEDGGSSCSSSGCGASVSATSSSDGSNSINDHPKPVNEFRRPTSLALISHNDLQQQQQQVDCNPIYDSVRVPRTLSRARFHTASSADFSDYKQLVGPDQAYPKGRTVFIENHSYASVVLNRCVDPLSSRHDGKQRASSLVERDDLAQNYANLPARNKASPVEYATVRLLTNSETFNSASNKMRLQNSTSDTSLNGYSYSTASANSGGFSALPPARIDDCSSANNFQSLVALPDGQAQRKSSLLKRFGSLVLKAFTIAAPAQQSTSATTSKINESSVNCQHQVLINKNNNNGADVAGAEPKSALVIERDHQVVDQEQVGKADLVILPTKHVNQRKEHHHYHQNQEKEQNLTVYRHDDRLSRGKKHSRKMKQTDDDCSTVISSSTSSSFSSSSSGVRHHHHNERSKRADSLSEELESLMSRSDYSTGYYRDTNSKKMSHSKRKHKKSTKASSGRIDIDCVSPGKVDEELDGRQSVNGGPLSLSRLFSAISSSSSAQRAAESTPNLANSSVQARRSSQCRVTTDQVIDEAQQQQQPISGFWGLSSLIGQSHATAGAANATDIPRSKASRKLRIKPSSKLDDTERDLDDRDSLMYTNLLPFSIGHKHGAHLSSKTLPSEQQIQALDRYQSLSMHQNLLRNHTKRRHCGRHHRHHNHHHYHHHRAHRSSSSSRHAHYSTRCAQNCAQRSCSNSSREGSVNGGEEDDHGVSCEKAAVWGQMIKINKLDGTQVIELQRAQGKSWGFFVARGSIDNVKGIFISRIHDNVSSNSLTGLLSIGDRILAIDECPIEPGYDILRVNQMISKKNKILLKVKPFKG